MSQGTIVQCIGAVVDVEFARADMPNIYDALKMDEIGLTLEVQQQLGDGIVRTIALGSSDGLRRGMKVVNTEAPITVPVGTKTLGRIMDVLGRPIDERGPVAAEKSMSIHRSAPTFEDLSPSTELLETGIKVDRPHLPVRQGRQDRPVRRRRRRQDRDDDGAHQQHRDGALGPVGVRRRRRAHARGQRLLPRDDGVGRGQQGRPGKSKVAMVYGQMNEPPGNRLRVALTGLTIAESFRDEGRDVLLFIDNIYRFTLGRHRSVRAARPHAFRRGLPADAGRGDGPAAGADHLDQDRLDHVDPGGVRAGGRPDRPVAGDDLRPPRRHGRAVARHRVARHLSVGRPARFDVAPGRPARDRRGALQHHARRAVGAAALQGAARHHRDPGHGRALARGQARGGARAQDPALPVAAVHAWPRCSPARPASTSRSRTRSRASR